MKKSYIAALVFTFLHGACPVNATDLTHYSTNIIFNQDPKLSQDLSNIRIYFDLNGDGKFDAIEDLMLKTKHINEFIAFGQYGIKDYQFPNTDYSYDEMMFFSYNFDMYENESAYKLINNTFADTTNNSFKIYHNDKGYYFQINNKIEWKQFLRNTYTHWSFFSSDPYPSSVDNSSYPVSFYFTPTKSFLDSFHGRKSNKSPKGVEMWHVESVAVTLDSFKESENLGLNKPLWEKLVPVSYPDLNNLCSDGLNKNCTQFPFDFFYATKSQREQLQSFLGVPKDHLAYRVDQFGNWELQFESNFQTDTNSPDQYKILKNKIMSIKDTTSVKIVVENNKNTNDSSEQWHKLGSAKSILYPTNSLIREIRVTITD